MAGSERINLEEIKSKTTVEEGVWQPFLVLFCLTLISQLASLAYSTSAEGSEFLSSLLPSVVFLSVLTIPFAFVGLRLGNQIGLGAPLLSKLLANQSDSIQQLFADAKMSIVSGFVLGLLLVALRIALKPYLPAELPLFGHRGVLGGFLVSLGAAIGEEVWFRLGLMTILVWVITRLSPQKKANPRILWSVIIAISIVFGMAHLPQLASYGAASPFAVFGTIVGNTVVGVLYGWLYWKRSLIAAIIAHFAVDVAIHVVPAFWLN